MNRLTTTLIAAALACLASASAHAENFYEGPLVDGLDLTKSEQDNDGVNVLIQRWRPTSGQLPLLWAVDLRITQQDYVFTGVGSMDAEEATGLMEAFFRNIELTPQSDQIEIDAGWRNFRLMKMRLGNSASCVVFRRYSANNMVEDQETEDGHYGMGQRKFYGVYCVDGPASPVSDAVVQQLAEGLRPPG